MDGNLSFTPSLGESVRDLEDDLQTLKTDNARVNEQLSSKIRSLETAVNNLIASNNLAFSTSRLPHGMNSKLLLKGRTAPNPLRALVLVRSLLKEKLNLDDDLLLAVKSAEPHGTDDILFDIGNILNKVKILSLSQSLEGETGSLVIQNQ